MNNNMTTVSVVNTYEEMIIDFFCCTEEVDRMLLRDVIITTVRRWKETKRQQKVLLNISNSRQYNITIDDNGNMTLDTHKMRISMKYRYVLIAVELLRRIEIDEDRRAMWLSRLCNMLVLDVDGLEFVY